MKYYLEKEEWKYCSMIKLVQYGLSHDGLFFLDGPLEVSNPNCYLGKITPYGGISTMGTHAWNLLSTSSTTWSHILELYQEAY